MAAKFVYSCANCDGPVTKPELKKGGTGLGTWRCKNGCKKRYFSVKRRVDSGKENEFNPDGSYPVRRAIKVRRSVAA